jgi:hypothetical protein
LHYGLRAHGFTVRAVRTARLNQPPSHWIAIVLTPFDIFIKPFRAIGLSKKLRFFVATIEKKITFAMR